MSRLVLSLLSLAAVHGFTPAKTPFALGRAGVLYFEGVGNDEVYAAASACLDEECSVDTADSRVRRATSPAPTRARRYRERSRRSTFSSRSSGLGSRSSRRPASARRTPTRTDAPSQAKTGRIVDYERDATLTGVRKMISDLEGPSDPNPFILAIRAAFDVKRKGLYATSPTA